MLVAQHLTKSYRGRPVVADVSLTAPAGAVTGFLGANGAGKTTVIRLMLGLTRGAGSTTFLGRPLADWRCPGRVVGASLGGVAGHPRHRIVDHLGMVAAGMGMPRAVVGTALDRVGLGSAARSRIGGLSLGMAQRVGIAQALLGDPPVLVLDEPANGLDPHSIRWLRDTLRQLAEEGRAVFVSSHLLAEMEALADRVVVMGRGRVLAETDVAVLTEKASGLVVETPEPGRLREAVERHGATVEEATGGRTRVRGLTRQRLGDLAVEERIPLYWLSAEALPLEEFYLSVADQEFEAR